MEESLCREERKGVIRRRVCVERRGRVVMEESLCREEREGCYGGESV